MKTNRLMSRLRDKAGLLSQASRFCFGLLNIAVEGKTIAAIFAPFLHFCDFNLRLAKISQAKFFILALTE